MVLNSPHIVEPTPRIAPAEDNGEAGAPSRQSPELEAAEIEGQFFDPTSGLTFLHRAYKRFSTQKNYEVVPHVLTGSEKDQLLMNAGDKPFVMEGSGSVEVPPRSLAEELVSFYFDVCVVTYRMFHRGTVLNWLENMLTNVQRELSPSRGLGYAKTSIIFTILAISSFRREKINGHATVDYEDTIALQQSDQYFRAALDLTSTERGMPRLESAQARLIQVLYLLQTSRMNQAWYIFGTTSQIISVLGLYRKSGRNRSANTKAVDYLDLQCRRRTFWVAYTLDQYLSVALGRTRHYHEEDIDQEFPDLVNDEDMAPGGPSEGELLEDCHVDALVWHAKLAMIISGISREVYSVKRIPKHERAAAAHRANQKLHEWHESLPPHLGSVRPSSLIPSFRRQAIALKLAYMHSIIHANRLFLLGQKSDAGFSPDDVAADVQGNVLECVKAARVVLQTFNSMVVDGTLFYAFWWTQYATFCALTVVENVTALRIENDSNAVTGTDLDTTFNYDQNTGLHPALSERQDVYGIDLLQHWQPTDWIDLDSSIWFALDSDSPQ
ncbi:hypothetical protein J7T55_002488 [Diaporthe amygdali]|uniref:uncharacterized protein n=1 Tax=Phomopsis amygdali TaxID=1214568 RepID=UPI0022FF433C|nr:uncharacterized protein J7T55_002488 [Diaporthe amygdali]KAJ0121977.1 hypothetical protein J7T55_002488 [Diaporthe amygdali]